MRIALIPLEGGRPIELGRDLTLVGRSQEADLKLDHKSVSKLHCILVRKGDGLLVRDLGSTNGTRINGQRIRRGALVTDDMLNMAHYTFRIEIGSPVAKPAVNRAEDNATLIGDISVVHAPAAPPANGSGHYPQHEKDKGSGPYQKRVKGKPDSSVRLPELPPPLPRGPLPDNYED